MRVQLRNDWFAPNGALYQASHSPHTFPDDWKDKLPKSAKVLSEEKEKPEPAKK